MKTCSKCNFEGEDIYFKKYSCSACEKKYKQEWYIRNKQRILLKAKESYSDNRDAKLKYVKNYRTKYPNKIRAQKEKDKPNKRIADSKKYHKIKNIPNNKIKASISTLINKALRKQFSSKGGISCLQKLEYKIEDLKLHLESLFEPWMNWENKSKYDPKTWDDDDTSTWAWQLDHIIPQCKLPYSSMDDDNFKKCWALENLRPYSAKQNLIDGNKR